ncbi:MULTISPECIES: cupin domain-containing protein [Actinomycetes]|uniref:Cupin domain-containing protein n=1 Tax=Streptomyces nondiastaticus TaxID=3154512 RepID=A0ABW6U1G4_9ACTN|nr:cupin domain-containing protein [Streptosporangium nondiastaticum]
MTTAPRGREELPFDKDEILPAVLKPGDGTQRLWGKGSLVTVKLTAEQTRGAMGMTHFAAKLGERSPSHIHTLEDEIFMIGSGGVRATVGDRTELLEGGSVLFLPRGIPHSYLVESETADLYVLTCPGGFERFFLDGGYPVHMGAAAPVGDRWSVERTQEVAEKLGLGIIWGS